MNRPFLVLLTLAVGVWIWVATLLVRAWTGPGGSTMEVTAGPAPAPGPAAPPLTLDSTLRDPFLPYLLAAPPPPKPKAAAPAGPALKIVEPPKAVLGGILWGTPPMAILKQDGKTEIVKAGVLVWDFKVLRIERHQVILVKEGREFALSY